MTVSAAHIQQRFDTTAGLDPIFRQVDGANCDTLDVSTVAARSAAYSLLLTRGLIRIAITLPANADYVVVSNQNPYGCTDTNTISQYRRPLPAANLRFLSTVMWDGRESSPITGTTKILYANYPASLQADLAHQAIDATQGHAQATPAQIADMTNRGLPGQIMQFESTLFSAQDTAAGGGDLSALGAIGGPLPLLSFPFFISINSSVNFLLPTLETPGGLANPGDHQFTPAIFNLFDAWMGQAPNDPRAAIARGQALFNSKPITITGVAGINDDAAAGGLATGGIPSLAGTCGTCHDTPNVGNHSFPTPLNIGVGDYGRGSASMGGLDLSYLPRITACRKDSNGLPTKECKTTTDLGQAAIDGQFDHIGKLKGPVLRGLSSRAPYFHNGSAQTLLDAVRFYEVRFGLSFTAQEETDLVAFLSAL
jgi:cytochrome c peroxidase